MCNYCTKDKLCYYHQKIEDGLIDEPEDTPEILEEHQQIWNYIPLVRSMADWLLPFSNLGYEDLCQQGYSILAELSTKVDWQSDPKMISMFVKLSVQGKMKKYIAHFGTSVRIPSFSQDYFDMNIQSVGIEESELFSEDALSPEDQLLLKERKDMLRGAVAVILPSLNEREFYVLFNCMLTDSPLTVREVANQFDCGKSSIDRDVARLKARLYEYIKA
jgi:DNA-directed RNA polymerase specialized sigma subunit